MTVGMRTWTCKGCEYSNTQVGTYYKMKKSWDTIHTLQFCKDRKSQNAFIKMFDNVEDALASLTIIK
jgi:hypothetical protein